MADRAQLFFELQDTAGNAIAGRAVTLLETDGTTPIAQTVYDAPTGGSIVTSHTTDSVGALRRYVVVPQKVKLAIAGSATLVPNTFDPDPGDVVTKAGAQTIGGVKTFSAPPLLPDGTIDAPGLAFGSDTKLGLRRVQAKYGAIASDSVDVMRFYADTYGTRVGFGNGGQPFTNGNDLGNIVTISHTIQTDNSGTIALDIGLKNNGIWGAGHFGDPLYLPDSAGIQCSVMQDVATARGGMRAIAAQGIRARAAADASTLSGIEIGIATSKAGHSFETNGQAPKTMGLWVACTDESTLQNLGEAEVEGDCAIYMSGNGTAGWRYFLYGREVGGTEAWSVQKTGLMRLAPNGNATAPQIASTTHTGDGVWWFSGGGLGIATGGTEAVRIDGSQNIGIGNIALTGNAKLEVGGNIAFQGNARRFLMDTANATIANRGYVQDLTTNAVTTLAAIPNGSGASASVIAANNSTPTTAGYGGVTAGATTVDLVTAHFGAGTTLPLAFKFDATEMARISSSGFGVTTALLLNSVISPTAISGNTDNWNPTGLSTATVIRADTSGAGPFNLTGIVAQPAGRVIFFTNVGSANIVLKNNVTSTAANRFFTPSGGADFTLPTNSCCILWYDSVQSCWKIMSAAGTSG